MVEHRRRKLAFFAFRWLIFAGPVTNFVDYMARMLIAFTKAVVDGKALILGFILLYTYIIAMAKTTK